MQLVLVSVAPHPLPKTTTLTHAKGLNPVVTNTLTFLGKERDYSSHFAVFVTIFEGGFGARVTGHLKFASPGTRAPPVIPFFLHLTIGA